MGRRKESVSEGGREEGKGGLREREEYEREGERMSGRE